MRKTVYLVVLLVCGCGWMPAGKAGGEQLTFITQESEMAETFTKWISLDGVMDASASWSDGVPDSTKIALFEPGSGVAPTVNANFAGSTWKGLIVEPGFPHDIAQLGNPLDIKFTKIIQHRGSGTLYLKLTKVLFTTSQMILDGKAVIDGVDPGSDNHVMSVLILSGGVQFVGSFSVDRTVQIRTRPGAFATPHVTVSCNSTNGSMKTVVLNAGVFVVKAPFEFPAGGLLSMDGGIVRMLNSDPSNFWMAIVNGGWFQFHPQTDGGIGELALNGGIFDSRSGTALKTIQRLVRTGGRLRLDDRTDINETFDLTRQ